MSFRFERVQSKEILFMEGLKYHREADAIKYEMIALKSQSCYWVCLYYICANSTMQLFDLKTIVKCLAW